MKKTIYIIIFLIGAILYSCTPDKYEIYDLEANAAQVDSILLIPNSKILYADGVSELNIDVKLFKIIETWRKDKVALGDGSFGTKDSLHVDILKVQKSRLQVPLEYYKDDGTKLPEFAKISTTSVEDFKIYIKVGDIQSEMFQIDVREPFPEKTKKVIPVIFHVLESEGVITPSVTSNYFQGELDEVNAKLSRRAANVSNGANANIEFKLALYAPDGTKLEEPGINRQRTNLQGPQMKSFLVEHTWDMKKYMNIFVCTYPPSNKKPHTLLAGMDTLVGLNIETLVTADQDLDTSIPENSGIIIGAYNWGYYFWQINQFSFLNAFSEYLGLFDAKNEDYCSDTYQSGWGTVVWADYYLISRDGFIFRPTNILAYGSTRTSVSGEQVERIHWVLENCPTHWAWKSDFAFTGVE